MSSKSFEDSSTVESISNARVLEKEQDEEISENSSVETYYDSKWSWFVAVSGAMNYLVIFGSFNAFGLFQEYYLNTMFVNESATTISWISTLSTLSTLSVGIFGGPIVAKIGIRWAIILASITSTLGLILASVSTKVWHLLLTQGIIFGAAGSILINVSLVMPSLWFRKHKNIAIAIISSGGGFGALVVGPIIEFSLKRYGIHWSFRILALVNVIGTSFSIVSFIPRPDFKPLQKVIDFHLLSRPLTIFLCIGALFAQWAYVIAPFYFPASVRAIGRSRSASSQTILIFSAASGLSRLASGYMGNRFGPTKVLIISMMGAGTACFALWLPTKKIALYYTFIAVVGLFSPLFFPLCPVIVARSYSNKELQMANGVVYFFYGISTLIGIPITGVLLDKVGNRTSYTPVIILAGILFILSGIVLVFQYFYCKKRMPSLKNHKI
ncbi:hypothetical protein BB560_004463 [Smittium megazygosporum]|uniref:Major facilitator superfamily (MFS) profile domain-containing protein n=1 Tax=Smittium megazygosporum TaxID=133381 RepID=A0A2T9Z952_9FUNG|nr:hypothetical protein BB560_004463 [Smittium megazygosporum]